jgi:hypothetical protein
VVRALVQRWWLTGAKIQDLPVMSDGRQLDLPSVLPHSEMLPKKCGCFCAESEVDGDENPSTVMPILQDTERGW